MTETLASKEYKKKFIIALAIFWGAIFISNGIFVYYANTSWTGLTSQHAYDEGLAYNKTLAAKQKMLKLGWQGKISFDNKSLTKTVISINLKNKQNKIITGATLQAKLVRPTREGFDKTIPLKEVTKGVYSAETNLPLAGLWDVIIMAKYGDDTSFFQKRLNTAS